SILPPARSTEWGNVRCAPSRTRSHDARVRKLPAEASMRPWHTLQPACGRPREARQPPWALRRQKARRLLAPASPAGHAAGPRRLSSVTSRHEIGVRRALAIALARPSRSRVSGRGRHGPRAGTTPNPMSTSTPFRLSWGILATGRIAAAFARGVAGSRTGRVVAAGSRSRASAERFAAEHRIPNAHGSYESLLADPEVQAVYIATPHPQHVEWTIRALEAGKHVLCEKPIGINESETRRMLDAARAADVTLMEAWMYRCHPLTERLVQLIRQGAIGRLRHVQASFSYHEPFNPQSRTWNHALGGGAILDVGGYPLSYARLLAGAAHGQPFLDPESLTAVGDLHPETGIDVHTAAVARFAGGITAELFTGVGV